MAGPLNNRSPLLTGVLLNIRAPFLPGVLLLFALLRFPWAANAAPGTPPSNGEPPRMVQARDVFEASQYAKADSVGRLALEDVEKLHGPRSLMAADLLDLLVRNAWKGKRTKDPKIKELAQRAVEIREKLQGETHPDLATSVYLQATLLRVSGDYESAAPVYERALSLRERIDGPSSRALGDVLNGYGQLLHRQGRLEEARAKLERSAEIFSKIEPPQNEALAYSLVNLANVLRDLDDLSGARTNAERALGIFSPPRRSLRWISTERNGWFSPPAEAEPARSWLEKESSVCGVRFTSPERARFSPAFGRSTTMRRRNGSMLSMSHGCAIDSPPTPPSRTPASQY